MKGAPAGAPFSLAKGPLAMPKTEHWQWYVEESAPTEQHHHAIDEVFYTGRSEFQQVAVISTPVFGKMLILDGDTQSSQVSTTSSNPQFIKPANGCGQPQAVRVGAAVPSWVYPTKTPKPKPTACAVLPNGDKLGSGLNGNSLNDLVGANAALQNVLINLSNQGNTFSVSVNDTALAGTSVHPNTAETAYDASGATPQSITFNQEDMQWAQELYGEDPTQVAFHEAEHLWYSDNSMSHTNDFSNPASGSIGGVTYTWNTGISQGYMGYQHFLIHNDIVAAFGKDTTNALSESLQQSNQRVTPDQAHALAKANAATQGTTSGTRPAEPSANAKCGDAKKAFWYVHPIGGGPIPYVGNFVPASVFEDIYP